MFLVIVRFSEHLPLFAPDLLDLDGKKLEIAGLSKNGEQPERPLPSKNSTGYAVTAALRASRSCWSGWHRAWSKLASMAVRRGLSSMAS